MTQLQSNTHIRRLADWESSGIAMGTPGPSEVDEALLQAMEQHIYAQVQWRSISGQDRLDLQLSGWCLRAWHQGRQAGEKDVPHELRLAFRAQQECNQAREAVRSARSARNAAREDARRVADPGKAELQKVRQIREALHHLKKLVEDHTGNAGALAAALHNAKAVGAAPEQMCRYEQMLKQWYDEQPFEVQISTLSTQRLLEISGAELLGDFKDRVAKELDWKTTRTKLLRCTSSTGLRKSV